MTEFLTKEQALNRDEDGTLLPDSIIVELWPSDEKPKIKYLPITKGQFAIYGDKETTRTEDEQIIVNHCKKPVFSKEDLTDMSPKKINSLVYAIVSGSTGVEQIVIRDKSLKTITDIEEELLKKKDLTTKKA